MTREDSAYWSYGYDSLGQVTSSKKYNSSNAATPGHDFAWTFDDIGNRKTSTINGASATYTPNSLNQYTDRTVPGVVDVLGAASADAKVTVGVNGGAPQATTRQGELFYKQVAVNNASAAQNASLKITGVKNLVGPNQEDAVTVVDKTAFVAKTPETFTPDADGNLTDDARWKYTWDGENRLVAVETSAGAAAAGVTKQRLEFAYDGQSRRVAKKVYAWNGSAFQLSTHTLFLYDGWNLLAELNALNSNAAIRTYVWGLDLSGSSQGAGGVGGLLAITDAGASTTHFTAFDGNGNVGGLINAASGLYSAKYDYNAFGETITVEGAFAASNPFRFSTKFADAETGHIYYGYRCYAPEIGRWLSRDPLEETGGVNLFVFCLNRPVGEVDRLGLIGLWDFIERYSQGKHSLTIPLGPGNLTVSIAWQQIGGCCYDIGVTGEYAGNPTRFVQAYLRSSLGKVGDRIASYVPALEVGGGVEGHVTVCRNPFQVKGNPDIKIYLFGQFSFGAGGSHNSWKPRPPYSDRGWEPEPQDGLWAQGRVEVRGYFNVVDFKARYDGTYVSASTGFRWKQYTYEREIPLVKID